MTRLLARLVLLFAVAGVADAAIDTYRFASEADRARYRQLTEELRCPKCQNQNIADSNAPVAKDLRDEIHRLLEAGRSDAEITDYLVARYGDFVRYRPPVNERTWLLWYGPAGLLAVGLVILGVIVIRRRRAVSTTPRQLSDEERQRLATLLDTPPTDRTP